MIKRLNNVSPGVKRPLRVEDLQELWEGLQTALSQGRLSAGVQPTTAEPYVVSGMNEKADGNISSGVMAVGGKLYYHPDIDGYRIAKGATIYASEVDAGDLRVFGDSTQQQFSFNQIISTATGGTLIGVTSDANLLAWKRTNIPPTIPNSYITGDMIQNGTITDDKFKGTGRFAPVVGFFKITYPTATVGAVPTITNLSGSETDIVSVNAEGNFGTGHYGDAMTKSVGAATEPGLSGRLSIVLKNIQSATDFDPTERACGFAQFYLGTSGDVQARADNIPTLSTYYTVDQVSGGYGLTFSVRFDRWIPAENETSFFLLISYWKDMSLAQ